MNSAIKVQIDACIVTTEAVDYRSSLRPAEDLFFDERTDVSELEVLRSLGHDPEDLDATAKLPMIDINDLPADVRANLGETILDSSEDDTVRSSIDDETGDATDTHNSPYVNRRCAG